MLAAFAAAEPRALGAGDGDGAMEHAVVAVAQSQPPRPGFRRATELDLGGAIAWTPAGALKVADGTSAREIVVVRCRDGCTVRYSFELLLERRTSQTVATRTIPVQSRTLSVPERGTGSIGLRLDAAARRAIRQARAARVRVTLRVGTRTDATTLRLR